MQSTINFSQLSISELKEFAAKLNAKIDGDRRLKQTWVTACELAYAAVQNAGKSIDEFTGHELTQTVATTAGAMVEAVQITASIVQPYAVDLVRAYAAIARWGFGAVRWVARTVSSKSAIARYQQLWQAVCVAFWYAVAFAQKCGEWIDAFVEECQAGELQVEVVVAQAVESATQRVKRSWQDALTRETFFRFVRLIARASARVRFALQNTANKVGAVLPIATV